jgi:hypothetical protein
MRCTIAARGHQMAPWAEVPGDESVSGQETLCLAHRFESLHLSLSPSGRPMRVLNSVIQVAALSMLDVREQFTLCHAVALQFVCDQDTRRIL